MVTPSSLNTRPKTFGICGGAFGDEGKGRIVDMLVHELAQVGPVVVYRDNGGANAGHTVEFPNGQRVAFHQLPSGVFVKGATVVLGKEMVIHPADLLEELRQIEAVTATTERSKIKLDEMALLSLDTHRAFEAVLKDWQSGGKGSTGRGISPAYADVLLRHPLRVRDIVNFNQEKIKKHYDMYAALIQGLGQDLATVLVPTLAGESKKVGTRATFIKRLQSDGEALKKITVDIHDWLDQQWSNENCGFVFEKAQAVGLDYRWGIYPDVTASDTTLSGIFSATEGIINPAELEVRAGVIKATYMSSVGARQLPTIMTGELADRIRKDAHEYGATTKRPRDIAYLDLVALKFYAKVGGLNSIMLTHMDISYMDKPIKICVDYKIGKKSVDYRPDQDYLNRVKPVYVELKPWDPMLVARAKKAKELPKEAQAFLTFISEKLELPITLITTGPQRDQTIWLV